jgi:transcriptional regulator with XRE-family HTH domain
MHVGSSDLSAAATEFRTTLKALGLTQHRVAKVFGVDARSIRRWQHGDRRIVPAIRIVFRLLAAKVITIDQVEAAADPSPIWTNGGAKEEPPAPLRVAPPPKQSVLACAEVAAFADLSPAAAAVVALTLGGCRWPLGGDPQDRDFRFCNDPVSKPPYCPRHALQAYLAPRPSRHGFRIGFVACGRLPASVHDRPSTPAAGAARAPTSHSLPGSAPPPAR